MTSLVFFLDPFRDDLRPRLVGTGIVVSKGLPLPLPSGLFSSTSFLFDSPRSRLPVPPAPQSNIFEEKELCPYDFLLDVLCGKAVAVAVALVLVGDVVLVFDSSISRVLDSSW